VDFFIHDSTKTRFLLVILGRGDLVDSVISVVVEEGLSLGTSNPRKVKVVDVAFLHSLDDKMNT
jgi:hypothetical protein